MRIIGGVFRGRRLKLPPGHDVRPTSDRTRETLFNILTHGLADWNGQLKGASVVDLFCGTGALGLEALSRGARHVSLIDHAGPILATVRKNAALGIDAAKRTTILKMDATMLAPPPRRAQTPCTIAFVDPPYGADLAAPALVSLKARGWLAAGGLAVVEVGAREDPATPVGFTTLETRTYGTTKLVFLKLRN